MKKTELKIKDTITLKDKIRAIEAISDSCFVDGDYTPYFLESNTIEYILSYPDTMDNVRGEKSLM